MTAADSLNQRKSSSLADQIKDTERKRLIHKRKISMQVDKLVQDIHQEITAPGSLLLAGGIGFIVGELTKRSQAPKLRGATTAQTSPLKVATSLITSAHTLYSALPLTLLIKSLYQSDAPGQSLQPQTRPVMASERAAKSRDRRKRSIVPPTRT
ncbi:hypothetical protein [Methylobacter sp.]|uniref:hypothetical protein n=1 Tax=Methylobacter sp. TaxID=2051955 RepID=UPI0025E2CB9C|nr:hypothetical protein [Methylobacter sp.]